MRYLLFYILMLNFTNNSFIFSMLNFNYRLIFATSVWFYWCVCVCVYCLNEIKNDAHRICNSNSASEEIVVDHWFDL